MVKWHQRYRIEWDATDGRNGGAPRTDWEMLMEMERLKYRAGAEDQGAVALVLDLAKAFERPGDALQLSKEDLAVLCGYFV